MKLDNKNYFKCLKYTGNLEAVVGRWLLEAKQQEWELKSRAIFISVDEYCLGFSQAGNKLICTQQDEDIPELAQDEPIVRFELVQWAAASPVKTKVPQPQGIWEKEDENLLLELAHKLKQQVKKLNDHINNKRKNTEVDGTKEQQHLAYEQAKIDQYNATLPPEHWRKKKRKMTPNRLRDFGIDVSK